VISRNIDAENGEYYLDGEKNTVLPCYGQTCHQTRLSYDEVLDSLLKEYGVAKVNN